MEKENEVEKFFDNIPKEDDEPQDIFDEKKVEPEKGDDDEDGDVRKNRRHRRLEEQLQRERDSNIALNERIKVLSEVEQYKQNLKEEGLDPDLIRVFGDTDAGKEIAKIMSAKLNNVRETAREEALHKFEESQEAIVKEQRQYETLIDNNLESLEDSYNIDLTSDAPKARKARREFLELVQQLSPKDEDGTITDYADFGSTFEVYLNNQEKSSSRNKEIASKSMQRSSSSEQQRPITPGFRGWQKDYNL